MLLLLLILHLQKCLKAPGPVTTVTPDQPNEAPGPVTPCTVTPDQPHTATIVEMFSLSSIYLYLHLQEYLEAPGPDTACNTRPTTIGKLSRRLFPYISLFTSAFFTSRSTLRLQALIPLVTPDQPQSATCRDVPRLFVFFPTNCLSNFARYSYQKLLLSHTSKHSSSSLAICTVTVLTDSARLQPGSITQKHLDQTTQSKTSTLLRLFFFAIRKPNK